MFPFVESLLDRVFFGFTLAPAFDISASCTHTNKCTYAVVNDYGFFEDTKKKSSCSQLAESWLQEKLGNN